MFEGDVERELRFQLLWREYHAILDSFFSECGSLMSGVGCDSLIHVGCRASTGSPRTEAPARPSVGASPVLGTVMASNFAKLQSPADDGAVGFGRHPSLFPFLD